MITFGKDSNNNCDCASWECVKQCECACNPEVADKYDITIAGLTGQYDFLNGSGVLTCNADTLVEGCEWTGNFNDTAFRLVYEYTFQEWTLYYTGHDHSGGQNWIFNPLMPCTISGVHPMISEYGGTVTISETG